MRRIGKIVTYIVLAIVIAVFAGLLLPRNVHVERSITINAAPEVVFPHVNSLKANEAWSPWMSRDPEMKINYSGPDAGVGAKSSWTSDNPNVGNGSQEIILSTANERVETALDFGSQGTAVAFFALKPEEQGTNLTWGFDTDLGMNPIARWMGLMFDNWIGADYETGLANLKKLVES